MLIIISVNIHDFQLEIGDDIGNGDTGDHSGNNRFVLFAADFITAVNRMHGDAHRRIGEQGGSQRTVDMQQENVIDRKACKKRHAQQSIKNKRKETDQDSRFCLMR